MNDRPEHQCEHKKGESAKGGKSVKSQKIIKGALTVCMAWHGGTPRRHCYM